MLTSQFRFQEDISRSREKQVLDISLILLSSSCEIFAEKSVNFTQTLKVTVFTVGSKTLNPAGTCFLHPRAQESIIFFHDLIFL